MADRIAVEAQKLRRQLIHLDEKDVRLHRVTANKIVDNHTIPGLRCGKAE